MKKLKALLAICGIIAVVLVIAFSFYKLQDYRNGMEGKQPIHGTYAIKADIPGEAVYLVLDEDNKTYKHYTNGKIIQSGTIAKRKAQDSYTLYQSDKKTAYAIVIPSYKQVYFVDTALNMLRYKKESKILMYVGISEE